MLVSSKDNKAALMAFIPSIQNNMDEWQIITVKLAQDSAEKINEIVKQLSDAYKHKEGLLLPINAQKIVLLVQLGIIHNYNNLKRDIENKLPAHDARVLIRKLSVAGLQQVQLELSNKTIENTIHLYKERVGRKKNVVLLVDDDPIILKIMNQMLVHFTNTDDIVEIVDGAMVVEEYLNCNPDVTFIDIHLPNKNGFDIAEELMELDKDAYIVVMSSDAVKENVIKSVSCGAVGFMAKPPIKEKVIEYIKQCITIN